jgi:hypothetical protein
MKKEALKRIFNFLEEKGEHNAPVKWKLINNIPLTEEDLNIEGDLDLSEVEVTSLPEGLKVGGYLNLEGQQIASLPKGLKVGDLLILNLSEVTSLPNDLEVKGNLGLIGTIITSLPKGLKVGGDLYIINAELLRYTNNELKEMVKPGFIKGKVIREW